MSRHPITVRLGALLALSLLLVVPGCSSKKKSDVIAPVVPASVSVNGYQLTGTPGAVEFNVSTLMSNGSLMSTATLTEPALTGLAIGTSPRGLSAHSLFSTVTGATAVCGGITSKGPVVASVCLDATGSMSSSDPNKMRGTAAKAFLARLGTSDVGVVSSFDTDTYPTAGYLAIRIYGGGFTTSQSKLYACVDSASFDGGSTNLWDAAYDCVQLDVTHTGANLVSLVLTDGGDNSSTKTLQNAIDYAIAQNVRTYMVALDASGYLDGSPVEANMKQIAQQTGGFYARADSASQLSALFAKVFNASHASGCVNATFLVDGAVPTAGTIIVGTMSFKANGSLVSGPFRVTF
jgi:hypothetical protein